MIDQRQTESAAVANPVHFECLQMYVVVVDWWVGMIQIGEDVEVEGEEESEHVMSWVTIVKYRLRLSHICVEWRDAMEPPVDGSYCFVEAVLP